MSALLLSNQCCVCSATIHPAYQLADGRCEDCSALAWVRYGVMRGIPPLSEVLARAARRRSKIGGDTQTAEYMKNFYSK